MNREKQAYQKPGFVCIVQAELIPSLSHGGFGRSGIALDEPCWRRAFDKQSILFGNYGDDVCEIVLELDGNYGSVE